MFGLFAFIQLLRYNPRRTSSKGFGLQKNKNVEIIGLISGTLVTLSFVPQIISVWQMKPAPAAAVSLPMYIIFSAGIIGWLIYGLKVKSPSITIANFVTLLLAFSIIAYKLIYG